MSDPFFCNSFDEQDWSEFRTTLADQLAREIREVPKSQILEVDEQLFVESIVQDYTIAPIEIDRISENINARDSRTELLSEGYGRNMDNPVYCFTVSYRFSGSAGLFKLRPTSRVVVSAKISVQPADGKVWFIVETSDRDPQGFKLQKDRTYDHAFCNLAGINREAAAWNEALTGIVKSLFAARKIHFLQDAAFFEAINVSVRPETRAFFSVPVATKKLIPQPQPAGTKYRLEPFISDEMYHDVLKVINWLGRGMERKPYLYMGKQEEELRDLFLLLLETRYEGSTATGETFNRDGKTDILLKYEDGSNLFVAECKFWGGAKVLHSTISQLFDRYLTWRDSKVAILFFVKNVDFTTVLQTIRSEAPKHSYFVSEGGQLGEAAFSYTFRLAQDAIQAVKLQILAFHFDK